MPPSVQKLLPELFIENHERSNGLLQPVRLGSAQNLYCKPCPQSETIRVINPGRVVWGSFCAVPGVQEGFPVV